VSVYSNLAGAGPQGAAAYVDAVLELLGERDPAEVLRTTVSWCRRRTAGLTPVQLATPEAEGKWSVAGVLQHLADAEIVWSYRLRRMLSEDRPELRGWDQDLWAERLGYDGADADEAMAVLASLRAANLTLLSSASPEDFERTADDLVRGEETVRQMLRLFAGHDLAHRRQLDRLVSKVASSRSEPLDFE